jgi:hypothetical protein
MPRTKSETPDDDTEPAPRAPSDFFKNLLRTLEVADTAAADAVVITMSVATLLPVIQAMMSFTQTSAENSRNASLASASLDALSLTVLSQACDKILGPPLPTRDVVYESKKVDEVTPLGTPPVVT